MRVFIFYILWCCSTAVLAQLRPANNSSIYYTQIMFEYPPVPGKAYYKISVSTATGEAFQKNMVYQHTDSSSAHLAGKIFEFGKKYYWCYAAYNFRGEKISGSPTFTFTTKKNKLVDHNRFKLDIKNYQPENVLAGIISGDNNMLYTRKGEPVFFLDGVTTLCRDFIINADGNFTYLDTTVLYECNLDNKILWQSPVLKTPEYEVKFFHHGVIKLANGNYLCMAKKNLKNSSSNIPLNAILEFNHDNKLVWHWFEEDHYLLDTNVFKGSHMNSIFIDSGGFLYVSNRDLNSIIKINRETGEVLYSIGYDMGSNIPFVANGIFAGQHHVTKLKNGNLLMLNNGLGTPPIERTSVLEIEEPAGAGVLSEPVWNYIFDFANPIFNHVPRMGGVTELENGNLLVGTGIFNRIFEMNRNFEVVWESNLTRKDTVSQNFNPVPVYRAHFMRSLYPSYFTIELLKQSKSLLIVNEGTENDTYQVSVLDKNKRTKSRHVFYITKESSFKVRLAELQKDDSVEVIPVSNPKRKRTALL